MAVVAAALLLLGGSAALPRGSGVVEVLKADARGLSAELLTTEALYVVRSDGLVQATPLCAGCPSWSAQITAGQRVTSAGAGTLVIDANDAGVATFVDARTGAVLWSRDGFPVVQLVGGRVADWNPEDGVLSVRDLRTGRLFWKRPAAGFTGDDRRIVLLEGTRAAVYAAEDGRELTGFSDLGVPEELNFSAPGAGALIVGERLIVFGGNRIASYRLDGLSREWIKKVVSPYAVASCGDALLCAIGYEGATVLDLVTGVERWNGEQWRLVTESGVLTDVNGRSARVDLATGRVEADFGRGRPVSDLVFYPEGDRTTLVGPEDGRVRAVIPRVTPDACSTAGDLLACRRYDLTVTVWRTTG
ncbi:PQQ-binding-like beta-propeller repeat protein [Actinoplanes sp. LDG1-06]|uniref:PQQ-binding-like beta-propeller repeat protein n=1 Tax=Paractinoplanes ovalisporus TaxID=2810368 RepID=A0ABS2A5Q9_9ACTN|nr:PQQ-binding-like beta-propeller repeat protein [Actinoplanes ovalisporus]